MSSRRLGALFGLLLVGSGHVPDFPNVAADRSLVQPESTVSEDEEHDGGDRLKNINEGRDLRKGMHDHGLVRTKSGDGMHDHGLMRTQSGDAVGAGAHAAQVVDDNFSRSVSRTEDEGDADAAITGSSATMFDMDEDEYAEEGPELEIETHHRLRGGGDDASPKEDNSIDNGEEGHFSSLPSTLPFLESEDSQMEPKKSADERELYVCSQFFSPSCPAGCVPSGVVGGRCVDPGNRFVNNQQYYGGNRFVNNQQYYGVRGGLNCGAYRVPNCPIGCEPAANGFGNCVLAGTGVNRLGNAQYYGGNRFGNAQCFQFRCGNCPAGCACDVNGINCVALAGGNRFGNAQYNGGNRFGNGQCFQFRCPNCPAGCACDVNGFNCVALAGGNRFANPVVGNVAVVSSASTCGEIACQTNIDCLGTFTASGFECSQGCGFYGFCNN